VVKYDEFLSLSPDEVIQLISCSDIVVPSEENVSKLKLLLFYYYGLKLEDGSICLPIFCSVM